MAELYSGARSLVLQVVAVVELYVCMHACTVYSGHLPILAYSIAVRPVSILLQSILSLFYCSLSCFYSIAACSVSGLLQPVLSLFSFAVCM